MPPTLYVSDETRDVAERLLRKGTGDAAREAVAILLSDESGGVGGTDAGGLLSHGLAEVYTYWDEYTPRRRPSVVCFFFLFARPFRHEVILIRVWSRGCPDCLNYHTL